MGGFGFGGDLAARLAVLGQDFVGGRTNQLREFLAHGLPDGGGAGVAGGGVGAPPVEVFSAAAPLAAVVFADGGDKDFLAVFAFFPGVFAGEGDLPAHFWFGADDVASFGHRPLVE